jgi:hypothetical protein
MPADRSLFLPDRNDARFFTSRFVRRAVLPVLAALALLAAVMPAGAAAAGPLPAEGIFDDCGLNTQMSTCLQRLQVIHSGGFDVVVIGANDGSPSADAAYAAAAQQLGMKVMWEISNQGWWQNTSVVTQFPGFASACNCSDNSSLLTYMIGFLGSLPGTYGYYAADDSMLGPGDYTGVSQYVSRIKAIDPSHLVLLSSGGEDQTSQYESVGDMNAAEIYPITTGSLMPVARNQDDWDSIGQWAKGVQRIANRHGRSSAFILQAFSWGDNLDDGEAIGVCTPSMSQQRCWDALMYPTSADQLELRNEVLKHASPSLILWWSFMGTYGQSGVDSSYSTYPTGAVAASHWAGLTAAVNAPAPAGMLTHGTRAKKHHHRRHRRHHHRRHRRRHHRRKPQLRHPRRLV